MKACIRCFDEQHLPAFLLASLVSIVSCSNNPAESEPVPSAEWHVQNSGTTRGLTDIHFADPNIGYAVGGFGTVLKTTDGGSHWESLTSPTSKSLRRLNFPNANTGYVVGNAGTIFKTTDGGNNWVDLSDNVNTSIAIDDAAFLSPSTGFIISGHQIYKTTDGGTNWTVVYTYSGNVLYFNFRGIALVNDRIGYACGGHNDEFGSFGDLVKTADGGESWSTVTIGQIQDLLTAFFPDDQTGFVFALDKKMYKTENGGTSWFQPTSFNFAYPILACCFLDSNTGYVVSYEGNILKTTDGGVTWNNQNSGIISTLTSIFFVNSSTGYAAGNDGVILKYY